MTNVVAIECVETHIEDLAALEGTIVIFADEDGALDAAGRRVNSLMRGGVNRLLESKEFTDAMPNHVFGFAFPHKLAAQKLVVTKTAKKIAQDGARKCGAAIAKLLDGSKSTIFWGSRRNSEDLALGLSLRLYDFDIHKTGDKKTTGPVAIRCLHAATKSAGVAQAGKLAEAVFFTRDLTNEPANVLTTTEFADRLAAMADIGLEVQVLEEPELEALGMRTLLSVGQGSESPSKVVVMQWNGGPKGGAPLALVGKGVVFDTGGISIKPAAGMEDMTMDMGGAGVVAGAMRSAALCKLPVNLVGIVGLVENMPDGKATRPGDVVVSMKGDTVEIINTDAEGRLVLADILWYCQERFEPRAMIDLATLTGAVIIGLGNENAGVFSNNDALCNAFLTAAKSEGEGAWRLPLGAGYDKLIKSDIADMKNVGGRAAGSITAAQFLQRFVKDDCPWIHLDIAGVAHVAKETDFAPSGSTGWGVLALTRLAQDLTDG